MPFKDLREFVDKLEKDGEAQRIEEELDWNLEAGAMIRWANEQGLPAPFFQISFSVGWILGGGAHDQIADIKRAGTYFGTAFQIADDIKDKDKEGEVWNFAKHYGTEEALRHLDQNLNACQRILTEKKIYSPLWQELFNMLR